MMFIKLCFPALLKLLQIPALEKRNSYPYLLRVKIASYLLSVASCLVVIPALGAEAIFGVVKSQENSNQWAEITTRLQSAGVAYCVIDLTGVKSADDLSDRPIVFLPNIQTLSPVQALAIEAWMSKGGRVIASGPMGNMSSPGVRQLLRSLLGAYWGFNLSTPSKLQPLKTKSQEWARQNGLAGTVQGGVIIPTSLNSQPAAIWESKDSPSAVVSTDRSTFLGWNWGSNATSVELDTAWLRAALTRYVPDATNINSNTANSKNCTVAVASTPIVDRGSTDLYVAPRRAVAPSPQIAAAPVAIPSSTPSPQIAAAPVAIPKVKPQFNDPLERLAEPGLQAAPNSKQPTNNLQAIALKQELENLIGRFESAYLTADARSTNKKVTENEKTNRPLNSQLPILSAKQAVAEARKIAKALPRLINQKNYTAAWQEWFKATQLLWNNYPTDRQLAQPEIRAMWLDRGTIVRAGSERELAKIFDKLAASGINTVFFETLNAGYPIYPSKVAVQQNPLVRNWDPLAAGVKLAHERGMELHAWVWVFAAGNVRHNALINLPASYPGPVITAHPDWASYDNRGSLFPPGQGKPFLDPANLQARQYLLQLFDEIVSDYQVDGLQLDYIRYPFQDPGADRTYGYGIAARQQFQQITGVDPTQIHPHQRELWQKWTEFRTNKIDTFVAQVSQQLRKKRSQLVISVAVFPLSEHDRIHKLQQHWEVWAKQGDVDLIVPMTYAQDTYRFQRLAQPWINSTKLGSALILPGIRLLNLPLPVAFDQIQLSRDLAVSGYSLFAVENLNSELQRLFQNTQGITRTSPDPIPYRQPFHTAAARYAALQQEWNFLLENKQLLLQTRSLSLWRTKSEALETALNQLSANPSHNHLIVAKESLAAFQSQFKDAMRAYSFENSYQVKVWSNRLDTLERLLNYGDRVVLKRESIPVAEQP